MSLEVVLRRPYGLIVSVDDGRPTLWVYAKLRRRRGNQHHICGLCKKLMFTGELAWRTVENALYRSTRVCTNCWRINGGKEDCKEGAGTEG